MLDFIDGEPAEQPPVAEAQEPAPEAEAAPQPQAEAPAPEPAGQPRGPDGRYQAAEAPEPRHVPLAAHLDERDKRKAAEQRAQELEQELARTRQPAEPLAAPDPYEDPQGYAQYQQMEMQRVALNTKLDMSEDLARQRHGDEVVDKARQWALERMAQSPSFRDEVLGHRNPYEYAVQQYERDQLVAQVQPGELEQFRAWKAAQAANPLSQPAPATPQQPAPRPPVSLATAPSAGGLAHVPQGPGQAFGAVFKG